MDTSLQQATLDQAATDVLGSPEDLGKAQAARAQISATIETFADAEDDGWPDLVDNCPQHWNPSQDDRDLDGLGDACDCSRASNKLRRAGPRCKRR
jgi:hypothetical protein